jgi:hypothetical protein
MPAKTRGQRLYEHKNPTHIAVVPFEGRKFATSADIMMMPNDNHTPWPFLSARCREGWERSADGHYLFSGEAA